MKILRKLAIQDLSLSFADKKSDKEIDVYEISLTGSCVTQQLDYKKTLENFIGEEVEIIEDSVIQHESDHPFSCETASHLIEDNALRHSVVERAKRKKRDSMVHQEIIFKTLCGRFLNKLYMFFWGHKHDGTFRAAGYIQRKVLSFLKKFSHDHKIYSAYGFGALVSTKTEKHAANMLAEFIEQSKHKIHGFLVPGIVQIKLADLVGDGKQRSYIVTYIHLNHEDYKDLSNRYSKFLFLDGETPAAFSDEDDPNLINKRTINIPKHKFVFVEPKEKK